MPGRDPDRAVKAALSKTGEVAMPEWLESADEATLRRVIDTLHRVHGFLADITDLDTLLERIMAESRQVAEAEASSLLLYDEAADELFFRVALGDSGDQQILKRSVRLKLDQGIAGAAARHREPVNVADAQRDPRFFHQADAATNFETRNILAVPLEDRGSLIGVLEVLNKRGGPAFTALDVALLQMFAGLVATAIANARLIEANMRAERLAAIGQAVAGLSHHTKNIVTGLGAGVDVIDQGLQQKNYAIVERTWPILKRSTRRIANFVEDMLAFSKPRKPIRTACAISDLLRDVEETFWALLTSRNVELVVDTDRATAPLLIDSRGMYRCLLNLLINAAEAVPAEGGVIRISASLNDDATIEVADNGPGIAPDDWTRVFDIFYSTKGSRGTGLGLAVARKIVEEHGGILEIGVAPEGGALFRIVIPHAAVATASLDDEPFS